MRVARTVAVVLLGFGWMAHGASAQQPTASQLAAMKAEYRRPAAKPVENLALVDLGRDLFWDPRASASGKTACVTCHLPNLGWGVTDARSRNDSGKPTSRKSQPLIGIGHAASGPFGWDGRSATPRGAGQSSIATGSMSMRETETPVKVEVIEQRFRAIPEYVARSSRRRCREGSITLDTMAKAIAAYERTMEPGSRRSTAGSKATRAQSPSRPSAASCCSTPRRNCFACHTGWRFTDDNFHDIGTPTKDSGRGREVKDDAMMQFAFKTPTLRSVALRPPLHAQRLAGDPL